MDSLSEETAKRDRPSVGIAFGGGAARGFAHIGVLEALSEAGDERLMPQFVAGTSTGSIMGALYAAGLSIETMKTVSEEMGWLREVVDVAESIRSSLHNLTGLLLPGGIEKRLREATGIEFGQGRGGFLSSKGLGDWVSRQIQPRESFDDLDRKLAIVATEIETGERVVFASRDLGNTIGHYLAAHSNRFMKNRIVDEGASVATAVRASSAIPVVFEAVREGGLCLADGGILDQVPVEVVRAMGADIVIGVSLGFVPFYENPKHPHESLMNLLDLMSREGIARSLSMADVAVEMPGIDKTSLVDMGQRESLIALGKTAMEARLGELVERVESFERGKGET